MGRAGLGLEARVDKECGRDNDLLGVLSPFNRAVSQFRFFVEGTTGVSGSIPRALSLK